MFTAEQSRAGLGRQRCICGEQLLAIGEIQNAYLYCLGVELYCYELVGLSKLIHRYLGS